MSAHPRRVPDPTPEEIAAQTALIRAGWTNQEYYSRSRFIGTNGQPLLSQRLSTEGVEAAAREALARRLADERRGATSLIARLRQFASAEGWTERAEDDELEIGWPDEEAVGE